MSAETPTSGRPEIDAALVLLAKLGVSPADLIAAAAASRPPTPTFAEFVPQVRDAVPDGTRRAYGSYWNRVVQQWGTRRLNDPTPLEIEQLGKQIRADRVVRRNGRGGSSAEELHRRDALPLPARRNQRARRRSGQPSRQGRQTATAGEYTLGIAERASRGDQSGRRDDRQ
ncbi:hypothetical protein ACFQX7_28010 [Luedemannella flava]